MQSLFFSNSEYSDATHLDKVVCWDLKLDKLSKFLTKKMIAAEGVKSKHSTELKHQEYMISSYILLNVLNV